LSNQEIKTRKTNNKSLKNGAGLNSCSTFLFEIDNIFCEQCSIRRKNKNIYFLLKSENTSDIINMIKCGNYIIIPLIISKNFLEEKRNEKFQVHKACVVDKRIVIGSLLHNASWYNVRMVHRFSNICEQHY
jgi:hypothetical protein